MNVFAPAEFDRIVIVSDEISDSGGAAAVAFELRSTSGCARRQDDGLARTRERRFRSSRGGRDRRSRRLETDGSRRRLTRPWPVFTTRASTAPFANGSRATTRRGRCIISTIGTRRCRLPFSGPCGRWRRAWPSPRMIIFSSVPMAAISIFDPERFAACGRCRRHARSATATSAGSPTRRGGLLAMACEPRCFRCPRARRW